MKRYSLPLLVLAILLHACAPSGEKDMNDFTDDPDFKNAHELPDSTDFEASGYFVEYATPDGERARAYEVAGLEDYDHHLFVIHEWWGLNDHIMREAERLHGELGIAVTALDMYDGKVATERDSAAAYMNSVTEERAAAIIKGALSRMDASDKVATIGWCFGGGWSLKAAILAGDQADGCVIYYGMPTDDKDKLAALQTDVLGIFAKEDGWITPEVVKTFGGNMKAAGKVADNHIFDAEHAFANPSSPRYKESAAKEANALALDYLKGKIGE